MIVEVNDRRTMAMSREKDNGEEDGTSYGEVLGRYFSVAHDIGHLVSENDRGQLARCDEFTSLKNRKQDIERALERVEPDHEKTAFHCVLKRALH